MNKKGDRIVSASRFIAILAGLMLDVASAAGAFGAAIYHVTTLADSGVGSLRDGISQSNRTVVFDVGGTVALASELKVKGASVIIDGFTAPSPGITLTGWDLRMSGVDNAHDVTVRGVRIRNSAADGITIRDGAYNILVDHVSIKGATDGSIDITRGAFDVTIQWSILAENVPSHNLLSLVDYQALRVTFHHNLFVKGQSRNPHSGWDNTFATFPPDTVTDIRNNLIWDFSDYGTVILNNTQANVVKNFYYSPTQPSAGRALRVPPSGGGHVYAQGNYSRNGANVDSQGNQPQPFLASPVDTTDACTAAQQVRDTAGVRPLDAIDLLYLAPIVLPPAPCGN
jgi:pectate lyase